LRTDNLHKLPAVAAALQAAQGGKAQVLIPIEVRAGHGAG
jgi:hypothetical protein